MTPITIMSIRQRVAVILLAILPLAAAPGELHAASAASAAAPDSLPQLQNLFYSSKPTDPAVLALAEQIGRASCRERV